MELVSQPQGAAIVTSLPACACCLSANPPPEAPVKAGAAWCPHCQLAGMGTGSGRDVEGTGTRWGHLTPWGHPPHQDRGCSAPQGWWAPRWSSQAGARHSHCPPDLPIPVLPGDTYPKHRDCEQQEQQRAGAEELPRAPHGWNQPRAVSVGVPAQSPRGWGQPRSSCMALSTGGTPAPRGAPALPASSQPCPVPRSLQAAFPQGVLGPRRWP